MKKVRQLFRVPLDVLVVRCLIFVLIVADPIFMNLAKQNKWALSLLMSFSHPHE